MWRVVAEVKQVNGSRIERFSIETDMDGPADALVEGVSLLLKELLSKDHKQVMLTLKEKQ